MTGTLDDSAKARSDIDEVAAERERLASSPGLLEYTLRVELGSWSAADEALLTCPLPDHKDDGWPLRIQGDRWTCSCVGGFRDVVELVQSVDGCSEHDAIARLGEVDQRREWAGFTAPGQPVSDSEIDQDAVQAWNHRAKSQVDIQGFDAVSVMLEREQLLERIDAPVAIERFSLGLDDTGAVVVPHISRSGGTTGYRRMDSDPSPPRGCISDGLYGRHLDDGSQSVVLCGDELDTWLVDHLVRGEESVALGLPTGLHGPHADWLDQFAGRAVTIAFPATQHGRTAAVAWTHQLLPQCASVSVVRFDEGTNARSTMDLKGRLRQASPVTRPNPRLAPNAYAHCYDQLLAKGARKPVSDFLFVPTHSLTNEDDVGMLGYAGYFSDDPGKSEVVISTDDMVSDAALRRWASRQSGGRSWKGSANAAASLNELLRAQAPFLSTIRMTRRSGLHNGVFVMPGETIAPAEHQQQWILAPDARRIEGSRNSDGPAWVASPHSQPFHLSELVRHLEAINSPETISPMLAWLSAAPLRVLLDQFPILAVMGQSGSGKTATAELLLTAWWGQESVQNIGSGTQFTDYHALGSSNTVPLALDEYRTGDTKRQRDRILEIDEVVRSSYRRSGTLRRGETGGGGAFVREIALHRPLMVLGETVFEDLAVRERSIIVTPLRAERRSDPFMEALGLTAEIYGSLGREFLGWLTSTRPRLLDGNYPLIRPQSDRPLHNTAVAELGWQLYTEWNLESLDRSPSIELDLGRVRTQWESAADGNPIWLEGIEAAFDAKATIGGSLHRIVFKHSGNQPNTICVNVRQLVSFMKYRGYDLPGGTKTAESALREMFPNGEAGARRNCGCHECPRSRVFDTGVTEFGG